MKFTIAGLTAMALVGSLQMSQATEMGDPAAGRVYANQVCAECHAVRSGQRTSTHERAPSFQTVANARGMTSTALRVWFQTPHPSMPNLMLTEEQSDNLVAYVLSLKTR